MSQKRERYKEALLWAHVQANLASRELRAQDGRGDTKVSRYPYGREDNQIPRYLAEKIPRYPYAKKPRMEEG